MPTYHNLQEIRSQIQDSINNGKQAQSKQLFLDLMTNRIKTAFIFSIAEFERNFGYLWGHDKPENELNQNEKIFLQMFKDIRKRILDNGNNQIRNLHDDLNYFNINFVTKTIIMRKLGDE
jgi:hypothetical protein